MKIVPIKDNHTFQRLYHAKFASGGLIVTYCAKSRFKGVRVGITTGKKIGCAVKRNRCRRIIRAAFRQLPPIEGRYDIVFVAREKAAAAKSGDVLREMRGQLRKLGVIAPAPVQKPRQTASAISNADPSGAPKPVPGNEPT